MKNLPSGLLSPMTESMAPFRLRYLCRTGTAALVITGLSWWLAPAILALLQSGPIVDVDRIVSAALYGMAGATFTAFMTWVSVMHGTVGICALTALAGIVSWRHSNRVPLTFLMAAVPGGLLLNVAVKHAVQRPRPGWGYALQSLDGYSFPSGHTAGATLFYAIVVILLWPHMPSVGARIALLTTATLLVLLVAVSRIFLGAHYMTDCVAATIEALVWLRICLNGAFRAPPVLSKPRDKT